MRVVRGLDEGEGWWPPILIPMVLMRFPFTLPLPEEEAEEADELTEMIE